MASEPEPLEEDPVSTTRLQRELAEPHLARRPTALDAFRIARRTFHAAERIDMRALAERVGVNRATLYRWVGSRDQLLVEIAWSRTLLTLEYLSDRTEATGAERIVQVVSGYIDEVNKDPGTRRWLSEEGESAMRLLTRRDPARRDTDFQPRLQGALLAMLVEETDAGNLALPVDLDQLAYVLVRLIESYVYLDIITGEQARPEQAEPILRLLLER
jgi:AcrR family transcriptional regulator